LATAAKVPRDDFSVAHFNNRISKLAMIVAGSVQMTGCCAAGGRSAARVA
jgi:hypothetical protein